MSVIRVLVVEDKPDHAAFLEGQLVGGGLSPEVVRGGLQALRRVHGREFSLALVDVDIASELSGPETADWLHRLYGVPVIIYSMRAEAPERRQGGAYLSGLEEGALAQAVSNLLSRRRRFQGSEPATPAPMLDEPVVPVPGMPGGFAELSAREWQIIRDLIEQPSAHAVAAKRQLSPHTVHNHLKSIFKKLDIHSVAELLSLMLRIQRQASSV